MKNFYTLGTIVVGRNHTGHLTMKSCLLSFILIINVPLIFNPKVYSQTVIVPELFAPGIISTGGFESHPAFTPDGKEVYFVKSAPDFSSWTICLSHLQNDKWNKPSVAPFSGIYNDADPFITKDGTRLYFISDRPIQKEDTVAKDLDIWYVEKIKTGWSEPVRLDTTVNSEQNEWYPTVADNGNLYFGSERLGGAGQSDIYFCRNVNGQFVDRHQIKDSVSTRFAEFEPFIFPDESAMIFMGIRPGGEGNYDFYFTRKIGEHWTIPVNVRELNSAGAEYSPSVTADGRYFFFASSRLNPKQREKMNYQNLDKRMNSPGNGLGDIYYLPIQVLNKILMK